MKIKTVAANIYQSSAYHLFDFDIANRAIGNLSKLRASMTKYGFLDAHPIHVVKNGNKYVIKDGQHRFLISQELGIPVKFVVCKDDSIKIPEINDAQRGWSVKDHVISMAAQGDPQYQYLLSFSGSHQLPVGVCAALLAQTDVKKGVGQKIRGGTFKVKNPANAEQVAAVVKEAKKVSKVATHHLFIDAVRRSLAVEGFDVVRFVKKMHAHSFFLTSKANLDGFLTMIETIYNYRAGEKLPVAFLAKNH